MITAVIFDLDGVIIHTDKYHYLAWKTIADELGLSFDEEMNHLLRGVSRMESMNIILEQNKVTLSDEKKEELTEKKNTVYRHYLQNLSEKDLDKEVYNTLISLKNKGIKIAIGSSSKNAKLILEQIGIIELFDTISDGTNISNSKPDPEVFLIAASNMSEKQGDCLVIEDANVGIEAGKRGGFLTASIGNSIETGYGDYHLETFSELKQICEKY